MFRAVLLLFLFCLGCAPAKAPAPVKKVLLIGLDGVRVDILAHADTPHIDALIAEGTFSDAAQTRMPTVSGPGWSSMLIGVWADKHQVEGNNFTGHAYDQYPDFLTRLERIDATYNTFAVLNWPPLGTTADGGPMLSDAIDVKVNIDGDSLGYRVADSLAVEAALVHLTQEDPDAAFVYIGNIDVVGHETSSLDPLYEAEIVWADAQVGRLVAALRNRPTFGQEDWLILMSTDHGRRDDGGHGQPSLEERTIFYLASGPAAAKGRPAEAPEIIDVAVTALTHFGIVIDPAWQLDGKPVGLK